ncbi:hypothetical protein ACFS5N_01875 [Mucilaginibacter ximonensis]|uniref:MORN repeat protein n=1 Tax=Mucilaginibacter ximonensis TaxID=538021 RepID=A0ABW5Y7H3_9SPHI
MKNLITFFTCFLCFYTCLAQETVERKNTLIDDVFERYQARVDSLGNETRVGNYLVLAHRKTVVKGQYTNGERTGVWYFYDHAGKAMQQYDFDKNHLLFEAPEQEPSNFRYLMDQVITPKDITTQPIKIGGRYFGYLPYLQLARKIHALRGISDDGCMAVLTLLVSPLGRLADLRVQLSCSVNNQQIDYPINIDSLPNSEKTFIPATLNGEKTACRITILCKSDDHGELTIVEPGESILRTGPSFLLK